MGTFYGPGPRSRAWVGDPPRLRRLNGSGSRLADGARACEKTRRRPETERGQARRRRRRPVQTIPRGGAPQSRAPPPGGRRRPLSNRPSATTAWTWGKHPLVGLEQRLDLGGRARPGLRQRLAHHAEPPAQRVPERPARLALRLDRRADLLALPPPHAHARPPCRAARAARRRPTPPSVPPRCAPGPPDSRAHAPGPRPAPAGRPAPARAGPASPAPARGSRARPAGRATSRATPSGAGARRRGGRGRRR